MCQASTQAPSLLLLQLWATGITVVRLEGPLLLCMSNTTRSWLYRADSCWFCGVLFLTRMPVLLYTIYSVDCSLKALWARQKKFRNQEMDDGYTRQPGLLGRGRWSTLIQSKRTLYYLPEGLYKLIQLDMLTQAVGKLLVMMMIVLGLLPLPTLSLDPFRTSVPLLGTHQSNAK